VPTSAPGFSCTPLVTVGGVATTASYYDNVRVPSTALVGELNEGWRLITGQLNHERVGLAAVSALAQRMWVETAAYAVDHGTAAVGWVQADLGRTYALLEAQKLLNWRMAAAVAADTLGPADSSAVKVFGTESTVEIYRRLLGVVGAGGYLSPGSPGAALHGELERAGRQSQINTFGGGVNEVQREILATAGLGMKRAAR
ncbi:MAG: acyl-CoA dehydrogenase family protein, partial [Acidimicrobiales bacterium]